MVKGKEKEIVRSDIDPIGSNTETTEYKYKDLVEQIRDKLYEQIYNDILNHKDVSNGIYELLAKLKLDLINYEKFYLMKTDTYTEVIDNELSYTLDFMGFSISEANIKLKYFTEDYIEYSIILPNGKTYTIETIVLYNSKLPKKKYQAMQKLSEQIKSEILSKIPKQEQEYMQGQFITKKKLFEIRKDEIVQRLKELYKQENDQEKKNNYIKAIAKILLSNNYIEISNDKINLDGFDLSELKLYTVNFHDLYIYVEFVFPNKKYTSITITLRKSMSDMKKEEFTQYKQKIKEIFCDLESEKILNL